MRPSEANAKTMATPANGGDRAREVLRDQWRDLRSNDRAAEQPDEREHPNDETLPIAGERRQDDQHDQNQVEGVGVHRSNLTGRC